MAGDWFSGPSGVRRVLIPSGGVYVLWIKYANLARRALMLPLISHRLRKRGTMRARSKVHSILPFLLFVLMMFLTACDSGSTASSSKRSESVSSKEECAEPQNPYADGGGHDAGFNWASENGEECNGNSDSFNEGCAEYHRQLEQYNDCIANSRH